MIATSRGSRARGSPVAFGVVLLGDGRSPMQLGDDGQRAGVPGPERLTDDVAGLVGGGLVGQRGGVHLLELHRQHRRCQGQEQGRRGDREGPGVPGDHVGHARPSAAVEDVIGVLGDEVPVGDHPLLGLRQHPQAHEAHQRWDQGEGGQKRQGHHDRSGVAQPGQEGDARQGQAAHGGQQRGPRKDHAGTGRARGAPDGIRHGESASEQVAVPHDQEQRVVDAHAQAEHRAQRGRLLRDVHQAPEEADDRQAHPDRDDGGRQWDRNRPSTAQREQQDDHGKEQAEGLGGPGVRARDLGAQVAAEGDARRGGGLLRRLRRSREHLVADVDVPGSLLGQRQLEDRGLPVVGQQVRVVVRAAHRVHAGNGGNRLGDRAQGLGPRPGSEVHVVGHHQGDRFGRGPGECPVEQRLR